MMMTLMREMGLQIPSQEKAEGDRIPAEDENEGGQDRLDGIAGMEGLMGMFGGDGTETDGLNFSGILSLLQNPAILDALSSGQDGNVNLEGILNIFGSNVAQSDDSADDGFNLGALLKGFSESATTETTTLPEKPSLTLLLDNDLEAAHESLAPLLEAKAIPSGSHCNDTEPTRLNADAEDDEDWVLVDNTELEDEWAVPETDLL
jgi:hypothetical protein